MNIPSIQVNNFNQNYSYKNKNQHRQAPAFGANPAELLPKESKLLSPLKLGYQKLTSWLSENYTDKIYTSKFAKKLADTFKKHENFDAVNLMQILGSTVISGMYILKTLQNKSLEDDKKPILALNQFLTFAVSTILGLTIDSGLNKWWENKTVKYLEKRTGDFNIGKNIQDEYNAKKAELEKKFGKKYEQFTKQEKKDAKLKKTSALKYLENNANIYNRDLRNRVMGMGVFKKLVIFGMIYRYLSPVLVTPVANKFGEKMLEKKREKEGTIA